MNDWIVQYHPVLGIAGITLIAVALIAAAALGVSLYVGGKRAARRPAGRHHDFRK